MFVLFWSFIFIRKGMPANLCVGCFWCFVISRGMIYYLTPSFLWSTRQRRSISTLRQIIVHIRKFTHQIQSFQRYILLIEPNVHSYFIYYYFIMLWYYFCNCLISSVIILRENILHHQRAIRYRYARVLEYFSASKIYQSQETEGYFRVPWQLAFDMSNDVIGNEPLSVSRCRDAGTKRGATWLDKRYEPHAHPHPFENENIRMINKPVKSIRDDVDATSTTVKYRVGEARV